LIARDGVSKKGRLSGKHISLLLDLCFRKEREDITLAFSLFSWYDIY
jgi:hypothetical protein